MEPFPGLVIGFLVALVVVVGLHQYRRRRMGQQMRRGPQPHGGQEGRGIHPDPGASRPAGPAAEEQAPDPAGGSALTSPEDTARRRGQDG